MYSISVNENQWKNHNWFSSRHSPLESCFCWSVLPTNLQQPFLPFLHPVFTQSPLQSTFGTIYWPWSLNLREKDRNTENKTSSNKASHCNLKQEFQNMTPGLDLDATPSFQVLSSMMKLSCLFLIEGFPTPQWQEAAHDIFLSSSFPNLPILQWVQPQCEVFF